MNFQFPSLKPSIINLLSIATYLVTVMLSAQLSYAVDTLPYNHLQFIDEDNDQINDNWEIYYFDSIDISNGLADDDYDADGYADIIEYYTGTHPTQASDFFQISEQTVDFEQGTASISFATSPNHPNLYYDILFSEDLSTDSWEKVFSDFIARDGSNPVTTLTFPIDGITGSNEKLFFRLKCHLPHQAEACATSSSISVHSEYANYSNSGYVVLPSYSSSASYLTNADIVTKRYYSTRKKPDLKVDYSNDISRKEITRMAWNNLWGNGSETTLTFTYENDEPTPWWKQENGSIANWSGFRCDLRVNGTIVKTHIRFNPTGGVTSTGPRPNNYTMVMNIPLAEGPNTVELVNPTLEKSGDPTFGKLIITSMTVPGGDWIDHRGSSCEWVDVAGNGSKQKVTFEYTNNNSAITECRLFVNDIEQAPVTFENRTASQRKVEVNMDLKLGPNKIKIVSAGDPASYYSGTGNIPIVGDLRNKVEKLSILDSNAGPAWIELSQIQAQQAVSNLIIRYANGMGIDTKINLTVNEDDANAKTVTLEDTGGWNIWGTKSVELNLQSGSNNTLKIDNLSGSQIVFLDEFVVF